MVAKELNCASTEPYKPAKKTAVWWNGSRNGIDINTGWDGIDINTGWDGIDINTGWDGIDINMG
jgi:hypothetical protein